MPDLKPIPEVIAELRDQLGEAILADFKGRAYDRFSVGAANAFPRLADEIERLEADIEVAYMRGFADGTTGACAALAPTVQKEPTE